MEEIEKIGRQIERDSARDIGDRMAHFNSVQQEMADLYHGDPAKFQAVLKFMASDTENLKSLGLTPKIETNGNDITGIWFRNTKHEGEPDAVPSFTDTESFRYFLTDPVEQKESIEVANAIAARDYGSIQAYLNANAADPAKLKRIFQSFDVLSQNGGLSQHSDRQNHRLVLTFGDASAPNDRPAKWPSVSVPIDSLPGYQLTDFTVHRRHPGLGDNP